MIDYNAKIEEIVRKYDLDRHYPKYRSCSDAIQILRRYFQAVISKVLIVGNDTVALKYVESFLKPHAECDMLRVVNPLDLKNDFVINKYNSSEKIYLVSYESADEIMSIIRNSGREVIWVFDILRNNGINIEGEFYQFYDPAFDKPCFNENGNDEEYIDSVEFMRLRKKYKESADADEKEVLIEKMFFIALRMRNFIMLNELSTRINGRLKDCYREIEILIDMLKKSIKSRNMRDVIIYWLDAIPVNEVCNMSYLESRKDNAYCFDNAYTVMHYTQATLKTILTGKRPVKDGMILLNKIGKDQSEILRYLEKRGYDFKVIGSYLQRYLDDEYYTKYVREASACSKVFWEGMLSLVDSKRPTVFIFHAVPEGHGPFLSILNDEVSGDEKYKTNARNDLDTQLSYYDSFVNESTARIYMSDHGRTSPKYYFQPFLMVWRKRWTERHIYDIFSYLDFSEIIKQVVEGEEINIENYKREWAPIEGCDRYNINHIEDMLLSESFDEFLYLGYMGVIDKENIYIKYRNGLEFYSRREDLPDKGRDVDIYTKSRDDILKIKEYREIVDSFPYELLHKKKFELSYVIDEIGTNIVEYRKRCKYVFNKLLEVMPLGKIALRTGGESSLVFLGWISEANRKKIGGIIDRDDNCLCATLEVPIWHSPDNIPSNIEYIIITSRDIWEKELYNYPNRCVICLNKILEQSGIHCNNHFYYGDHDCYRVSYKIRDFR